MHRHIVVACLIGSLGSLACDRTEAAEGHFFRVRPGAGVGAAGPDQNGNGPPPATAYAVAAEGMPAAARPQAETLDAKFTATGGTAPYVYSLAPDSTLPNGIVLTPDGALSGTFLSGGQYSGAVRSEDSAGAVALKPYAFDITPSAPTLGPVPSPSTVTGNDIVVTPSARPSGNGPYAYALLGQDLAPAPLPSGWTTPEFSTATGTLSGQATVAGIWGPYVVRVTDRFGTNADSNPFTVGTELRMTSPATAQVLKLHSTPARTTAAPGFAGGNGPYVFSVETISGTPQQYTIASDGRVTVQSDNNLGAWAFRLKAVSATMPGNVAYSGQITAQTIYNMAFSTNPATLLGPVGVSMANAVAVSSSIGQPTYALIDATQKDIGATLSTRCPGLGFSSATGSVSGKPTATCDVKNMRVLATDVDTFQTISPEFSVTVTEPAACYVLSKSDSYDLYTFNKPVVVNRFDVSWSWNSSTTGTWYNQVANTQESFAYFVSYNLYTGRDSASRAYNMTASSPQTVFRVIASPVNGSADGLAITASHLYYAGVAYQACP